MLYVSDELPEDLSVLPGYAEAHNLTTGKKNDPVADQPASPAPEPDAHPDSPQPECDPIASAAAEDRRKRNSGKTGPTSLAGKAISAFNAMKHGLLSKTRILPHESQEEWDALLHRWRKEYGFPPEDTLLSDFILKTVTAEWQRLRMQLHYDLYFNLNEGDPIAAWNADEQKSHDLTLRYLTTAERRFQREHRQLELHYKTKLLERKVEALEAAAEAAADAVEDEEDSAPKQPYQNLGVTFQNAETGEVILSDGTKVPPPPGFVPQKIIPGVYGPLHPSNLPPAKGLKR